MISYIYKARDEKGKMLTGHLRAMNETDARKRLRDSGCYPTSIIPEHRLRFNELMNRIRPIGLDEIIIFCQQFYSMTKAGLPILESFDIIWKQTENEKFQIIVSKIRNDLSEGLSLFDAVRKYPNIFPPIFVNLIRVGEASGTLDNALQNLIDYFTKEYELRQRVKSLFFYPSTVLLVAIGVVAFMVTVVVPVFKKFFVRLEKAATLPLPTLILVKISELLRCLWWTIPLAFIVGVIIYNRAQKTKRGRYIIDRMKLRLPLFGKLIHKVAVSRFARALGITVGSGIPINQALRITRDIPNNVVIKNAILNARTRIVNGSNLHQPLAESGLFPDIIVQMIATGEEAGTLDKMLLTASDQLDQEIDYAVKKLTVMLEPALTLILGAIVFFVALSLYLPIFDIAKLMR